jgi:uncharacterized membrane protein (UPF0127 family)
MTPIYRIASRSLAAFALAGLCGATLAQGQPAPLPVIKLTAGIHLIEAEVADNPARRAQGLMYRERMAVQHGMVFVFDEKGVQCMWMRNTLIALSVAFIAEDGSIVNIEDMKPRTEESHCAKRPVRYALEMNQGWFAARGIKPGFKIGGLPAAGR